MRGALPVRIPGRLDKVKGGNGRVQGTIKVYWASKGPLTRPPPSGPPPLGERCDFDLSPSPLGRGGTARRGVRGLFEGDEFVPMEVSGARDFEGTFRLRHDRRVRDLRLFPREEPRTVRAGVRATRANFT